MDGPWSLESDGPRARGLRTTLTKSLLLSGPQFPSVEMDFCLHSFIHLQSSLVNVYVLGKQTLFRISAALKKLKGVTGTGRKNCSVK